MEEAQLLKFTDKKASKGGKRGLEKKKGDLESVEKRKLGERRKKRLGELRKKETKKKTGEKERERKEEEIPQDKGL